MFIDSNKNAQKVIGILYTIVGRNSLTANQEKAINAVTDLLDELQVEGRWS